MTKSLEETIADLKRDGIKVFFEEATVNGFWAKIQNIWDTGDGNIPPFAMAWGMTKLDALQALEAHVYQNLWAIQQALKKTSN